MLLHAVRQAGSSRQYLFICHPPWWHNAQALLTQSGATYGHTAQIQSQGSQQQGQTRTKQGDLKQAAGPTLLGTYSQNFSEAGLGHQHCSNACGTSQLKGWQGQPAVSSWGPSVTSEASASVDHACARSKGSPACLRVHTLQSLQALWAGMHMWGGHMVAA